MIILAHDRRNIVRTAEELPDVETETASRPKRKIHLRPLCGWGAMSSTFRPYPPQEWQPVASELRDDFRETRSDKARGPHCLSNNSVLNN